MSSRQNVQGELVDNFGTIVPPTAEQMALAERYVTARARCSVSGVDFALDGGRPLHPDEGSSDCPSGWSGYTCTRAVGHAGRHQANGITYLWAEWDSDE